MDTTSSDEELMVRRSSLYICLVLFDAPRWNITSTTAGGA